MTKKKYVGQIVKLDQHINQTIPIIKLKLKSKKVLKKKL